MQELKNVYTRVTDKIISDLNAGVRPWFKPWTINNMDERIVFPCRHNGIRYRGINVITLWNSSVEKGFSSDRWITFKQACELGGRVRKGEKGELVVYAKTILPSDPDSNESAPSRSTSFLKGYTVFNVEQCDGLPADCISQPSPTAISLPERLEFAKGFFANTKADIRHGGLRAYYAESQDYVQLPQFETFTTAESYAATLAHEITHWTKHKNRLSRDLGRKRFGDDGYALEELFAELGSAFLCAYLGITPEVREDHAAYIATWLQVLKNDNRVIFSAASHAQRAVEYLQSIQP